jgi:hypothetical protein
VIKREPVVEASAETDLVSGKESLRKWKHLPPMRWKTRKAQKDPGPSKNS